MTTRRDVLTGGGALLGMSLIAQPPHAAAQAGIAKLVRLRRDGNTLWRGDRRFVFRGVGQYALNKDWQAPCEAYYANRKSILDRYVELGINTQRLGLWAGWYINNDGFFTRDEQRWRLAHLCLEASERGIYTIIGLWDTLGKHDEAELQECRSVGFPLLQDLLATAGIGDNPFVMFEPWNEPGMVTGDVWRRHYALTIEHLRGQGYDGLIFVNTPWWSWEFAAALDRGDIDFVLGLDREVCFCNHRYPQGDLLQFHQYLGLQREQHEVEVMRYVGEFPIMGSEYGWHAHHEGVSQNHPVWMTQLLDSFVTEDIPSGFNGACLWKWKWSTDSMTPPEDYSEVGVTTLNDYGKIARERFWTNSPIGREHEPPRLRGVELSSLEPRVGSAISAFPIEAAGYPYPELRFLWQREKDGAEIGNEHQYVPTAADRGSRLVCRVIAHSRVGPEASIASQPSEAVI